MIIVEPLDLSKSLAKGHSSIIRSKRLVTLIRAYDPDTKEEAVVGIRFRRTQSTAELTYWSSNSDVLLMAALLGAQYQLLLEGRKRIEVFLEHTIATSTRDRGYEPMTRVLSKYFVHEGFRKYFTQMGEDVDLYGWSAKDDSYESPRKWKEVQFHLAENEEVKRYRDKNEAYFHKLSKETKEDFWESKLGPIVEDILSSPNVNVGIWSNMEGFVDDNR